MNYTLKINTVVMLTILINKYISIYNPYKVLLGKILDFLTFPLRRSPQEIDITQVKKVLILQSHLLGDLVICTSLIYNIKKIKNDLHIDLLANQFANSILQNNPDIFAIHSVKFPWATKDYSLKNILSFFKTLKHLSLQDYDVVIDGQVDFLNIISMLFIKSKHRIGIPLCGGKYLLTNFAFPDEKTFSMVEVRNYVLKVLDNKYLPKNHVYLYPTENDIQYVNEYLTSNNVESSYICIHPGASQDIKRWGTNNFSVLINNLTPHYRKIILIEGPGEELRTNEILLNCQSRPLVFKGSLLQVAILFKFSQGLICMDSVASHIANAMNTKTLVLFGGHQDPSVIKPSSNLIKAITPTISALGINGIKPDDVFSEFLNL